MSSLLFLVMLWSVVQSVFRRPGLQVGSSRVWARGGGGGGGADSDRRCPGAGDSGV